MTDVRDKPFIVRQGKANPCPSVQLVDGKTAITLPEMRRARLGKKMQAHAPLQITPGFGP